MKAIFVTDTAGSGRSLLSSKIYECYTQNGAFTAILNLEIALNRIINLGEEVEN